MSDANNWSFETLQVHAGQTVGDTNARALPIYQTTSYVFNDTDHAANLFALAEPGNIYTRIMNPTQDTVEQRIAALEGGVAALLLASGQAATTYAIQNLMDAGSSVVASPRIYGGTQNLFAHTLPKFGIEVIFVEDPDDPESWRAAIQPNTRALFGETVANPHNQLLDVDAVAAVAHENGLPLIIDNTVATPYLYRPIEHGADIVVESATKYLGGHGTSIGGVIVDGGTFDWRVQRDGQDLFPGFTTPDPSYGGVVYADLGAPAFALKARVQLLRDTGSAISPFNAFLIAQGIETLSLRMERHVENAQKVAEYLEAHPQVESVAFAGLESSPYYELGRKHFPKGTGAVIGFEISGGLESGKKFVDGLELHSHVANIGDVRSLVIHPASTTHAQLSPDAQAAAGVTPGLIRLAAGIENIDDILADLDKGFAAAKA
ncbi:O-acetylhomoserine (thiol)-lyase [Gordonia hirsuta DSM 44140 = NBRC 16056]|uniref:O-acetylhomoserine (Thiol)-lyase n=1 Tax=Gordonia hirsuta DSM 44140 = NBRC 16056 TaxID=1121927 RepID=L7L9E6_9ACTN|nr:bifunctional o-acetylhomoserine/o-acetylserine sulfhydrylase [Gordonia hirsuta]GAC56672.1 O-acetylhomoserine (thiol)-lyase [Gordonia hirsuta DSM 44140 = NBRC 16056]